MRHLARGKGQEDGKGRGGEVGRPKTLFIIFSLGEVLRGKFANQK